MIASSFTHPAELHHWQYLAQVLPLVQLHM